MRVNSAMLRASALAGVASAACPDYLTYSTQKHQPYSKGTYQLSYMRPAPECRTFNSSAVNNLVNQMQDTIADPDLYRMFQNAYPNTLDTAIKWKGVAANNSAEELTFVITGDINAMWLRDSANQMQSYLPVLKADSSMDSIASLYRGVINLQTRYILTSAHCNSFQPPVESGLKPAVNGAASDDTVTPPYNNQSVFECKYELDSLAAFLEVSSDYYNATNDLEFFGKFQWVAAVQEVMNTATAMMTPTYGANGKVLTSPYTFTRLTTRATETLANNGLGYPVANETGLIRSAFRPSDDSTIFQLLIPSNMMFSHYLGTCADIMEKLSNTAPSATQLAGNMRHLSESLRQAIMTNAVVHDPNSGKKVFAYEIDGFGSQNIMDDANIPSLLSAPLLGFLNMHDETYQSTRAAILDKIGNNGNPYYMRGPVFQGVGGPHDGPGYAWPMAEIVRILTSDDDQEITDALKLIVSTTDGLGLVHESINTFNQRDWTRQW